ncbi:MAG TPA: hypothetical protein VKX96_13200 [Chloroflexota bacterium]|nr:hypothetical protein [Chloroflexota bacterium]
MLATVGTGGGIVAVDDAGPGEGDGAVAEATTVATAADGAVGPGEGASVVAETTLVVTVDAGAGVGAAALTIGGVEMAERSTAVGCSAVGVADATWRVEFPGPGRQAASVTRAIANPISSSSRTVREEGVVFTKCLGYD